VSGTGSRRLSGRRGSITPAQRGYLASLVSEATRELWLLRNRIGVDTSHLDLTSASAASAAIGTLVAAKGRGWDRGE